MADKITANADGTLNVSDEPDHPLHRGRRHRRRHLAGGQARARRRRREVRPHGGVEGGARRGEGLQRDRRLAPAGDRRHVPGVPDRHQGPAHHADRRRLPQPQRGAAPDPRPLRVPAPRALVPGRALAGEAPRAGRHGDLPGEHRGHLRRPRGRGGHARGQEAPRAAARRLRLGHPRGLGHRHQADLRDRLEAPDPRRHQLRAGRTTARASRSCTRATS